MGLFGGDGYDAIQARFAAALDDGAVRAVVLRVDSPGGEVAGCFEAARTMRTAASTKGKPVVAYADEMACSAAYALACIADEIVVPDTGVVGSVGVIATLAEESAALAAEGIAVAVITSGAAKADGHPAVPLADDARARIQAEVDYLADVFAGEVAGARGMTPAAVRGLEARVFYGPAAVAAGLADRIGNLNDAVARAHALADKATRKRSMNALHALLGLSADATDAQVAERVTTLAALDRDARALTTTTDTEAARGALRAVAERAAKADEFETALKTERAERRASERAALKKHGVEVAKVLAPADVDTDGEGTEVDWVADMSNASLRSYIDRKAKQGATVVPTGEVKPPKDAPTPPMQLPPAIAELAAKRWTDLTAGQKAALFRHDAALARRLRKQSG
jgi:signal peptide peptidase SppA